MAKADTTGTATAEEINVAVEEALRAQTAENEKKIQEAVDAALATQAAEYEKKLNEVVEKAVAAQTAEKTVGKNVSNAKTVTQEEMVKVTINRERKDQGDVEVSVNGKVYQIKRGVEVEVPRSVKEVLDNMKKMDALRMERIDNATRNFS